MGGPTSKPYFLGLRGVCVVQRAILAVGLALGTASCAPFWFDPIAMSCSEFIGGPISAFAAYGPPSATFKVNPTPYGYDFVSTETGYVGGEVYYTVNYMVGVDAHVLPLYPAKTVCRRAVVTGVPFDAAGPALP